MRLNGDSCPLDMLLDVPVDEGGLSGRVVANQHHADLLPWWQQLQVQVLSDADQAVAAVALRVSVQGVALLQYPLVQAQGRLLHHIVGRDWRPLLGLSIVLAHVSAIFENTFYSTSYNNFDNSDVYLSHFFKVSLIRLNLTRHSHSITE